MRVISRRDAKRRGKTWYFTGRPCSRGHVTRRYTSSGTCATCRALTGKRWQQANLAKFRRYNRASYAKHAPARIRACMRYRRAHPHVAREAMRRYRERQRQAA